MLSLHAEQSKVPPTKALTYAKPFEPVAACRSTGPLPIVPGSNYKNRVRSVYDQALYTIKRYKTVVKRQGALLPKNVCPNVGSGCCTLSLTDSSAGCKGSQTPCLHPHDARQDVVH